MDLHCYTSIEGNLNNQNSSMNGLLGMYYKGDKMSFGANGGFGLSAKDQGTMSAGVFAGYNSDMATNDFDGGIFAGVNGSLSAGTMLEKDNSMDYPLTYLKPLYGESCGAEVGYRFKSYSDYHTNVSAFTEYSSINGSSANVAGLKYELSDGSKSMYAKAGIQNDKYTTKPYVGVGARLALGF